MRRPNTNKRLPRCKKDNECPACSRHDKNVKCIYWSVKKIEEQKLKRCGECSPCKRKGSWKKYPCKNAVIQKPSISASDKEIIFQSLESKVAISGKTRSSEKQKKNFSIFERDSQAAEKAKEKLCKTADILGNRSIKNNAKYFSKHPITMQESSYFELKILASIVTHSVIETFSPYPSEVIQMIANTSPPPNKLAADPMIQAIVASFINASKKDEKVQFLSTLVAKFSRKELNEQLGLKVSRRLHLRARRHLVRWGAGAPAVLKKIKRCRISKDSTSSTLTSFRKWHMDHIQSQMVKGLN